MSTRRPAQAMCGVEQPRETAGVTTRLIIHYIRRVGGDPAVSALLAAAGEGRDPSELEDECSWSSYDAKVALFEAAAEVTGDDMVARRIGEAVLREQVAAPVKLAIAALGSPQQVLRSVAMANAKFSTNSTMRCLESSRGRAVVTYRLDDGYEPSLHDCLYTQGILSQATVLFGQPPPSISHPACQVRGAPECRYEVSWPAWRSRLDRGLRRGRTTDTEVRALRQQLADLQRTGAEIVSSTDLDVLLARIASRASTAMRAQRYLLAVHLEHEHGPRVHSDGFSTAEAETAGAALLAKAPVCDDEQLIVEVASATRRYGRLAAYMPGKGFLPQDRTLLEAYASLAAAALDNATALASATRDREVSDALLDLAAGLASTATTTRAAAEVVAAVPRVVGAQRAVLMLWDATAMTLVSVAQHGFPIEAGDGAPALRIGGGETPELAEMLTDPKPRIYTPESPDAFIQEVVRRFDAAAVAVAPIVVRGTFLGTVHASWHGDAPLPVLDGTLFRGLSSLADQAGLCLDGIRMLDEVRHQATHDPLTGLPNRVLFMDRLAQALALSRRRDEQLGVCFCDLDGFKEINDEQGHAAGDAVLIEVARRISHTVRASDTVARLSGDEFGIVLRAVDEASAGTVAEKIVEAVSAPFEHEGRDIRIRVSIGVAVHPAHGDGPEELLQRADAAMYAAKEQGSAHRVAGSDLADGRNG